MKSLPGPGRGWEQQPHASLEQFRPRPDERGCEEQQKPTVCEELRDEADARKNTSTGYYFVLYGVVKALFWKVQSPWQTFHYSSLFLLRHTGGKCNYCHFYEWEKNEARHRNTLKVTYKNHIHRRHQLLPRGFLKCLLTCAPCWPHIMLLQKEIAYIHS